MCHVSLGGFNQHLRFYFKDLLCRKRLYIKAAEENDNKSPGVLAGNGRRRWRYNSTQTLW